MPSSFSQRCELPAADILSPILEALYGAPLDASGWDEFLSLTAAAAGGESAALLMYDSSNAQSVMSREWGFHPEVTHLYAAHYGAIDIWRSAVTASSDWVGISEQFVPASVLARSEFYNDLLLPYGIPHGIFAMVERGPTRVANLSICRGARYGPFEEKNLELVRFLKPHIQRAFKLHFQLSELRVRSKGIEATLNMLATGVIFLGGKGEVLLSNRKAEELLAGEDGLSSARGRLISAVRAESDRLQALIYGAVQTGRGSGLSAGGTLSISRQRGRPLWVTVAPLGKINMGLSQLPAAVILISDPDRTPDLPADLLQRCYGLTPAEGRLAMLLLEGRSLKEAGDFCEVTYNTAKSQLKIIFSKTRTQRQGELIRLLLNTGGLITSQTTPGGLA